MDYKLIDILVKHGIGVFTVVAGTAMLWYLVKESIIETVKANRSLADSVLNLVSKIDQFGSHVRREHEECNKNQREMQKNQQEMIFQLKEITLTLGRINGYKKEH